LKSSYDAATFIGEYGSVPVGSLPLENLITQQETGYQFSEDQTRKLLQAIYWGDGRLDPPNCDGALPSRLVIGEGGRVTPGTANNLREGPELNTK